MVKRIDTKYIIKECKKMGYTLINEYKNNNTTLFLKDKKGYIYSSNWISLKCGHLPNIVNKNNPYSIQNMKLWMKINNIDKYELISTEYSDANEYLIFKDKDGYMYSSTWTNLKQNTNLSIVYKNNPYSIQNIKLWIKNNAIGYELLSTEYVNNHDKLLFKCPKGHKFEANWNSFKNGSRCPYCSNKKVLKGYNDIATTDSWMIELGMSREDAETHTRGSGDMITVTCPYCGKQKRIVINKIYDRKHIGCICGKNGISYSEMFTISLLEQLNINYIREYKPSWSNNKRYDFYLQDYNCIIECHGDQHYNVNHTFKTVNDRTLQEEQENDRYKKELALCNNIKNYVILDCRESTLEQIKNSILNSELNKLFNLSIVNWNKCEEFALSNKVKEICDYWYMHNEINCEKLTTVDIGKIFNLERSTICRYLKRGNKLGWCNYNGKKEQLKASSKAGILSGKPVEVFKDGKSLGVFPSTCELEKQSEELFGVKLLHTKICLVCNGKQKHHKGFTFKYL